jgi:hypothetical protein
MGEHSHYDQENDAHDARAVVSEVLLGHHKLEKLRLFIPRRRTRNFIAFLSRLPHVQL